VKGLSKAIGSIFEGARKPVNQRVSVWAIVLVAAAALLAGCHGDPNVRKVKYLESGKRYSDDGKYREAAIQFSNALKVDRDFADAHYDLAQAYVHMGEFGAARSELMHTVDLQPTNYKARIDLGELWLAIGKTEEAQTQANAVVAAQPDNADVHAILSAIAAKEGHKDQALIEIHRALEIEPNRAAFHQNLALLQSGDPAENASVEEELKKSVSLDPKSANAKLVLASFYVRNSRWQQAEQASRDAVATDPNSIAARTGLARVYLGQGNQHMAEEVLRQASQNLADNPEGARLLADYFASSGQMDKAKVEFSSLAAKYPKSVSVQKGYIRILLQVKDYATARTVVASLMKISSKDPETVALNGIVLLNDGKANDAVNALQEGVKNFPQDAFIQYWLGKSSQATNNNALAEKSFRRVVELNPSSLDGLQELARIAGQRGDMSLLADVAQKAIVAAPHFAGGYVWRAIVEINRNSVDKAEADLKTAIAEAPQSAQAYLQLGKLRFAQKRIPEGASLLEQALQRDPDSIEALRLLTEYDVYRKQTDKALARLNAQIAKSPRNSSLYDLLAQLQVQNKNLDLAASTAQTAMQLNPADGEALMLFAQIAVQRGQVANAVAVWERWQRAYPNDAGADAILGTLEESRGNGNKAEDYYRKALQIQPQQSIAANNLAYLMLQNGENTDVALTLAQTARQGMPNSSSAADTLAWAYYHKGTYAFARDLLEDATKAEPNNPTIHYHLGMVYSKLQDKANAAIQLKRAASLSPDSPAAKDARAALQGMS
jgi:tetratricopeptide (TPR) repeat protein